MIAPRFSIRATAIAVCAVLTVALFAAWRADRRDRERLAADLAVAKQALTQATDHQRARDTQLQQALAAIAAQKRSITTPAQILRALPKAIPLPEPINLQSSNPSDQAEKDHPVAHVRLPGRGDLDSTPTTTTATSREPTPQAILPSDDLKPIYDFALDCQACQAKLAASQADLADEKAKTAVLTKERDEAVRVAKGGSALRRLARATKWFLLGAAAGILASHSRL